MSPFSASCFLGHPKARASASKASGCFMGGNPTVCEGGTGKAEAAKLQDVGITLKRAQKNERQKKAGLLNWEDRYGIGRAM